MTTTRLSADVLHIHHGQSVDLGLLTPIAEPVFPPQEFRFAGPMAPVKRLALGLIDDARTMVRFEVHGLATCWWLLYETSERPMSFAWCCTALGLDADYLRRGLRAWVQSARGTVPDEATCYAASEREAATLHPRTPWGVAEPRPPRPPRIKNGSPLCSRGHDRTNAYRGPNGKPRCRMCVRINSRDYQARRKQRQLGRSSAPESAGHDPCHPLRAGNGRAVEGRSTS